MFKFIKGLFSGDRFVSSKYLDNQFDCFIDYVDVTEEDLYEKIAILEDKFEDLYEKFDEVLVKATELMLMLERKIEEGNTKVKNPIKAKKQKTSKKVKSKKK